MKEKIILAVANLLDDIGVKFTIDDIKNELKISKKTIYKYFSSKEELAQAVFDYIINKSKQAQRCILLSEEEKENKMILCLLEYMEVFRLQSEKIFNLYSLNQKLLEGVRQNVIENWNFILDVYHEFSNLNKVKKIDDDILKIIIEGIFKNIYYSKERSKIGYNCIKIVIQQ